MKLRVRRLEQGVGLFALGVETYRELSEYHFAYGSREVDHGRVWTLNFGRWAVDLLSKRTDRRDG